MSISFESPFEARSVKARQTSSCGTVVVTAEDDGGGTQPPDDGGGTQPPDDGGQEPSPDPLPGPIPSQTPAVAIGGAVVLLLLVLLLAR